MHFYSFVDEFIKIAGVGLDVHGYSSDPDKPPEKWLRSRGYSAAGGPDEIEEAKYEYSREARIKTPFDRQSSRGYKMHLHVLQGVGGDKFNRKALHEPSPFVYQLATDQVYADKPKTVNLNKRQLRTMLKDYQARRQTGNRDEEVVQDAFINKTKSLLSNRKLRFARVEFE